MDVPMPFVDTPPADTEVEVVTEPMTDLDCLKMMVQRQATTLEEFVRDQRKVNQEFLNSLVQLTRSNATASPSAVPAEATVIAPSLCEPPTGQCIVNPLASSTPQPIAAASRVIDRVNVSEWKEVAMSLAKRSLVGPLVEKPLFNPVRFHPVIFLERFDRYFRLARFDEVEKLEVVRGCLIGTALDWMSVRGKSWRDFEHFKGDFLAYFWSIDQQHAERTRLTSKRFIAEGGLSMPQYFLKQVSLFRAFQPPIPEEMIVADIMRQYPQSIRALWAVCPVRDVDGALKFLERQDVAGDKRPRTFSEPVSAVVAQRPRLDEDSDDQEVVRNLVYPFPPPSVSVVRGSSGMGSGNANRKG
ncbi:hypothetical protein PPYR_04772 [Photinus pyralis]|uniref:Uncharacterized protein n=1 Tax=Photinus pyralis TaxID=7054 RepID=A0A1Y1MZ54_PHOPY|nr:uncharacterized protein LOC116175168 [Photinus pyralis]KAB0796553.1 hypothetical protein PPYR_10614 [Photinus pyralis]KAB0796554.1 hypothetical protein PPYR_10615 [Photinus pyralis]KAB0802586.1 hypothetical protein PPYR_04772 [Photinus pyralis]